MQVCVSFQCEQTIIIVGVSLHKIFDIACVQIVFFFVGFIRLSVTVERQEILLYKLKLKFLNWMKTL